MKISLILLLVAGPLAVWGQQTVPLIQAWAPGRTEWFPKRQRLYLPPASDTGIFRRWMLAGNQAPVRLLMPDHMPCLVTLWRNDRMKISFRSNTDKMPNGWRPPHDR